MIGKINLHNDIINFKANNKKIEKTPEKNIIDEFISSVNESEKNKNKSEGIQGRI